MTYETYEELKQRITERARQLWEEDGRPEGRDMEYWLKAEDELAPHSVAGEEDPAVAADEGPMEALDCESAGSLRADRHGNPLDPNETGGSLFDAAHTEPSY